MISRLVSALALLVTVAACAPAAAPPAVVATVAVTRAAATAPPVVVDPGPQAMVWTLDKEGRPTTRWLAPAEQGYREVGEAAALLVAVGPDVWRWSTRTEAVKTVGCASLSTPPGEGSAERAFVERVGSAERVTVVSPESMGEMNEIKESADLVGSVGPYLFVRERMYAYGCGAHGSAVASLTVWDLDHRRKVELLEPAERAALAEDELLEARAKLPASDEPPKVEDVTYQGTLPRYGARGALQIEHAFSTFACYACGDGAWGSYSVGVEIPAHHLPERVKAHAHTPAVVSAWLHAHPGTTIAGWSEVSAEAARVLGPALAQPAQPAPREAATPAR